MKIVEYLSRFPRDFEREATFLFLSCRRGRWDRVQARFLLQLSRRWRITGQEKLLETDGGRRPTYF